MDTYQALLSAVTSAINALDAGGIAPVEARAIVVLARELSARAEAAAERQNSPHP